MAHQLYVYQSLGFSPLVDVVNMRGNASNQVRYRIVVSLTESKGICCDSIWIKSDFFMKF